MNAPTLLIRLTAVMCTLLLVYVPVAPSETAQQQQTSAPEQQQAPATKIPNDQLDSLVAPIALYPDPLLAQVLAASTYPLEIMQLQQWLGKNKDLKDKALADAVAKQPWDPSVQALAGLPEVVKRLADDIQWTTDLGNAFLAQQNDVMEAVQRMRVKAKDKGNLKSNEQVKVETKVVESQSVIVVEQANPQVVYVPSYNPTVVYGPPPYPYPPITYPPPGYYAAGMAISFGVGVAMGAMWSGGWGYNCGWGGNNNITINNNNNFNRNSNIQGGNRVNAQGGGNRGGNGSWQHNPQHRGGTPYSDRSTADRFGGTARGDSMANRQANARQRQQGGGNRPSTADRGGVGDRGGAGDRGGNRGNAGTADRGGAGDRGGGDRGGNRPSAGTSDRGGNRGGGGDRVGDRSVSSGSNGRGGAFGGSSNSGASARKSSSRGSSSMGGSRGGSRGGGGRRR
jgi:Protein of unknown function (DUF3300)